jgi:hypothetical protein
MEKKKYSVVLRRVRQVITEYVEKTIVPVLATDADHAGMILEKNVLNDPVTLDSLYWTPMWVGEQYDKIVQDPRIIQVIAEDSNIIQVLQKT